MTKPFQLSRLAIAVALSGAACTQAFASAHQQFDFSTAGVGRAYSGSAAIAEDASTVAANPAGLSRLDGAQYQLNLVTIAPDINLNGDDGDGDSGNLGAVTPLPTFFYASPIDDKWSWGVGGYSTYAIALDYSSSFTPDAALQYDSMDLTTYQFTPSVAYQMTPQLSVGLGANVVYGAFEQKMKGLNGGDATIDGDDWGFGWNLGFLYELNAGTRFGLTYHSAISLDLEGDTDVNADALGINDSYSSHLVGEESPAWFELAAYHQLNNKLAIHGSITHTNWDDYDQSTLHINRTGGTSTTYFDFHDTWGASIGMTYQYSPKLVLRTGFAYEESPLDNTTFTVLGAAPEGYKLAFGGSYQLSEQQTIDFAFAHTRGKEDNLTDPTLSENGDAGWTGDADVKINTLGIGYTYRY